MEVIILVAVALVGYLLGSLNAAIIVSRLLKGEDIRAYGSGNAGMTNMLRTYGKGPAVLTALVDFLKPMAAILPARFAVEQLGIHLPADIGYLAGIAAMLGHLFPVYFGFKGGKGALTVLGVLLFVNPLVFLIVVAISIPLIFVTRIVSLGSILGAAILPVVTWIVLSLRGSPAFYDVILTAVIGFIIIIMHRGNIKRLIAGTENRIGNKKGG